MAAGTTRELPLPEVAARLGCSVVQLYRLWNEGIGPPSYKRGRRHYVDEAELERWLRERSRFVR